MDEEELLQSLSQPLGKLQVQELAAKMNSGKLSVQQLLDLCSYDKDRSVAFRAAWVLEYAAYTFPKQFLPYLPVFIGMLPTQHNLSCQRHFSKILMCCANPDANPIYKAAWRALPDREPVVESMFEWLINSRTPVAVKVNCLDVLVYLQPEFPWVKDELLAQIEFLMKDGSPAMLSRGKRILKRFLRGKGR
ncbi:hypothetical protein [Pontibacter ramchanderi]|uniref:DNA alkylation repair enzyme n=1 Tax=Pontibacter ramchanderi TaxID=1179743 RepID=A0A2N3U898_9BACT|nr:hypothetical protein [Pontibacter ramchanderi]PKV62981.1 hypothetical protein BD749_2814 [Pontibacter ramchanderi]